ncbi:MAG: HAD-IA family hydrolase [Bryobacteraceae bacterium]
MIPPFRAYLFDVDGTLVDSAADICGTIQEVLRASGRDDVEDALLRRYIGRHLIDLFTDLGYPEASMDQMVTDYRAIYTASGHVRTTVYPGVSEMLSRLGGLKSTATTKGTPTTKVILEKFGLMPYFNHVQGTDGFPAKPEPDVILKSLEIFNISPADCLMVGDAPSDMEAGRRAGVQTCAVRYGYGDQEAMARFSPDFWIDHPSQLA